MRLLQQGGTVSSCYRRTVLPGHDEAMAGEVQCVHCSQMNDGSERRYVLELGNELRQTRRTPPWFTDASCCKSPVQYTSRRQMKTVTKAKTCLLLLLFFFFWPSFRKTLQSAMKCTNVTGKAPLLVGSPSMCPSHHSWSSSPSTMMTSPSENVSSSGLSAAQL